MKFWATVDEIGPREVVMWSKKPRQETLVYREGGKSISYYTKCPKDLLAISMSDFETLFGFTPESPSRQLLSFDCKIIKKG